MAKLVTVILYVLAIAANVTLFVLFDVNGETAANAARYLLLGVPLALCATMAALAFTEPPGGYKAEAKPRFSRVMPICILLGWLFYGSFWGYGLYLFFTGGISLV